MTSPRKRFRPRFSIRTLAILITLVCCYAACWGPTKRDGPEQVQSRAQDLAEERQVWTDRAVAPLIIATHEWHLDTSPFGSTPPRVSRCYYFWFFGIVAKLPWERRVLDPPLIPVVG